MDIASIFLIMGAVILIGFTGRLFRDRTKIPESLFLIFLGLSIGPITGLFSAQTILDFVPVVSTAAMVCILIESGTEFKISRITESLGIAVKFTILVAVLTTAFITIFLFYIFNWPLPYAILLGIISSGTTTLTAMALLKNTNVIDKIKNLIFFETIFNDFTLIIGTFIVVELIKISDFSLTDITNLFMSELAVGLTVGIISAFFWRHVLLNMNKKKELIYASTLGICFVMYYLVSFFGGSPIIAIFTFSLILANYDQILTILNLSKSQDGFSDYLDKIKAVQTDFGFFIASSFFVMLGMVFDPSVFTIEMLAIGVGIVVLVILARAIATKLISKDDKDVHGHNLLISFMIPRGYVAAVLMFVPLQQGILIPGIANIIIFLIIVSTIIAIIGTAIHLRTHKEANNEQSN